jgi:hypothetical protein
MWSPNFGTGAQVGSWIRVHLAHPVSFDHLDLQIVADGRHSVPTAVRITTENGSRNVVLPAIADKDADDATVSVPVTFPSITGRHVTVTFTRVRIKNTISPTTRQPVALPLGIAELGIPGVRVSPMAPSVATTCRSNLLTIDGRPVWTEVTGSTQNAAAGQGLTLEPCGPDSGGITLTAGRHVVQGAPGQASGLEVDQLVLDSKPGGGAAPRGSGEAVPSPKAGTEVPPRVRVVSQNATALRLKVTGATKPFWLVLGESLNAGWTATVDGAGQLGAPTLVDGFGNGWTVDPAGRHTLSVTLRWTPQTGVDVALVVSIAAALGCLGLAAWPRRRSRPARARHGRGNLAMSTSPEVEVEAATGSGDASPGGAQTPAPALANPFASVGTSPPWFATAIAAVGTAVVAFAIVPPSTALPPVLVGLAVGAAVLLGMVFPRMRGLLALAAVGFTVSAVLYTVVAQASHHFPAPGWPSHFERANVLVWAALAFLAGDVVVGLVRSRRR